MFRLVRSIISLISLIVLLFLARLAIRYVYPLDYYPVIQAAALRYDLNEELICAVIHTESRFNRYAVSNKDAMGLMQLTRQTAEWGAAEIGLYGFTIEGVFEPDVNIEIGCWYLSRLINQYDGDVSLALTAYNGGSGNVAKWLNDDNYSKDGITLFKIPFPETSDYVERVERSQKLYTYLLRFKRFIY